MATLHVRKVPDPLYEAIRERAEREGRSIGGEVVCLLEEALYARGLRRRPGAAAPFAADGRRAIAFARDEAREHGRSHIGTEHLLLGLLRVSDGPGARALASLGVDRETVAAAVLEEVGRGGGAPEGAIPFAPDSKQALELALRESLAARSGAVDTGDVLLGLARVEDGVAARIMTRLGVDLGALRGTLIRHRALGSHVVVQFPEAAHGDGYRVLRLTGSVETWERKLNDVASEGWRLLSIEQVGDEHRAVLAPD